ncbi:trypsin-like peptidase domain-containing protein [Streptomyces sp. NPDC015408]|uniref:trypsin-like peptidase domain-containing protein n=1 Tax=Streptomyces sp. NPDC015408 TaxID=3364956 RepID=UPI0036FA2037
MNSEVLKRAIVRVINNAGFTLGTGFLATREGHILTCWHVVDGVDSVYVQFEGDDRRTAAALSFDLSDSDADVAVLRILPPADRAPAALAPAWEVGDPLWSYGYQYQEHFASGFPVEGRISGDTRLNEQQLIVVSGTDVQRGLSGAPVLNLRTGKVAALVNAKFDDRGIGFAVPIAAATRHWSTLTDVFAGNSTHLRSATAELFKAMGYQVHLRPELLVPGGASFLAELATGATRLRTVVACATGFHQTITGRSALESTVLSLQATTARERLDRAFLVTLDHIAPEAARVAESAGVVLLTYDELEGRLIDFSAYLRHVVHDYEHFEEFADFGRLPVIEPLRWCDLRRFYIDIGCFDPLGGREHDSARAAFREFVADPGQSLVSFLGDYGTGKTTLCLQLTYELARDHLENPLGPRIPVFVQLRDLDPRTGVRRFVMDALADAGVRITDPTAFDIMLRGGRFVLFLDGFDEVADRLDRRSVLLLFNQISHLTQGHSKVVLTCRTHYFRNENQTLTTLTAKTMTPLMQEIHRRDNFQILELRKYDELRIMDLMSRYSPEYRDHWRWMKETYNLADLARTPILMNIMMNSLSELLSLRPCRGVDTASLYNLYTKVWLDRDDARSDVTIEERARFTEELAWRMYRDDRLTVPHEELADAVAEFLSGRGSLDQDRLDRLDTNIRTCNFLARTRHGDYQFAHKSFMEFFVAKALVRQINEWSRPGLWPRAVPYEVSSFVSELLEPSDAARLKQASLDRTNNYFLRGLCMDVQMSLGDTVNDEPLVFALAASPDGSLVASGQANGRVGIFTASLDLVAELEGHDEWVRTVAFSPDGRYLASGAWDNHVLVRSLPSFAIVADLLLPDRVNTVCFSADGDSVFCGGYDRVISMWDIERGLRTGEFVGHADTVHHVTLNPADGDLVSCATDRTVRVWPAASPGVAGSVEAQDEPIRCLGVSHDGQYIATGSWTGELILWDARRLHPIWRDESHDSMINSFAFSPDGQFVSCSDDRTVQVWTTSAGGPVATLVSNDFVMGTAFSPDGRTLYSGGYDCALTSWETTTWTRERSVSLSAPHEHHDSPMGDE